MIVHYRRKRHEQKKLQKISSAYFYIADRHISYVCQKPSGTVTFYQGEKKLVRSIEVVQGKVVYRFV